MATLVAMPKSRVPSDDGVRGESARPADQAVDLAAENPQPGSPASTGVTPLDGEDFLAANRSRRAELRAESADRVPRKLDATASESGGTRRIRRIVRGRALVGTLALLVVVLAISTGVLAYLYVQADGRASDDAPSDADRATVLDTARRYAVELTTYDPSDYADLDRRITEISTPEFGKTYIASSQDARKGNANVKGVSTAKAQRAGVESMTADRAVVLVALDQTVKSSEIAAQVPDGIPYQSRVEITLTKRNGEWLLDDLATV